MERQDSTGGAIGAALLMVSLMIGMVAFIFSITGGRGPRVDAPLEIHTLPTGVDRQKASTNSGGNFKPERIQQ